MLAGRQRLTRCVDPFAEGAVEGSFGTSGGLLMTTEGTVFSTLYATQRKRHHKQQVYDYGVGLQPWLYSTEEFWNQEHLHYPA